ncbi:uncharacterized protein LOC128230514 [Mya arenaria]|uniref:uncharacterized protein LOC128230514 n=1 Tax=Mya arenaria TaxID=6604 RepID=UPI0022E4CEBB|nr:uncharacterized protein LOC128230514 [Mya arenaria]
MRSLFTMKLRQPPGLDLPLLCIFTLINLIDRTIQNRYDQDRWDHITIRYGFWYDLPTYQSTAFKEGYERLNDVCKTDLYHGFLFRRDDNMKAMPIYDLNGNLAGIQSAIPSNMRGYNSFNETIDLPPLEIMPPVLKGIRDSNGILYYTVTAYFKHPRLICSPVTPKGVLPGRGLYIQMGYDPEDDFYHIPRDATQLSPLWRKGNCRPQMGTLYFMNMSNQLPCEKIYPLFLLYDMEGNLGAFGWVFQGRPNNFFSDDGMGWFHLTPPTYPFLYDPAMLPACMFNENFQVFGIHVYLQEPNKLLCEPIAHVKQKPTTQRLTPPTRQPPKQTYITSITHDRKRQNSENYAIEALDTLPMSRASKFYNEFSISVTLVLVLLRALFLQNGVFQR